MSKVAQMQARLNAAKAVSAQRTGNKNMSETLGKAMADAKLKAHESWLGVRVGFLEQDNKNYGS